MSLTSKSVSSAKLKNPAFEYQANQIVPAPNPEVGYTKTSNLLVNLMVETSSCHWAAKRANQVLSKNPPARIASLEPCLTLKWEIIVKVEVFQSVATPFGSTIPVVNMSEVSGLMSKSKLVL